MRLPPAPTRQTGLPNGNVGIGTDFATTHAHPARLQVAGAANIHTGLTVGFAPGQAEPAGNQLTVRDHAQIGGNLNVGYGPADPAAPGVALAVKGKIFIQRSHNDFDRLITIADDPATNQNSRFSVYNDGRVFARRIRVELQNPFPDYVFSDDYNLLTFSQLQAFIETHRRLPGLPPAAEVAKEGLDLGEMQRLTVEKLE